MNIRQSIILFSLLVSLLGCAPNLKYSGEIVPIDSPILVYYSPFSAKEITTFETLVSNQFKTSKDTFQTTCDISCSMLDNNIKITKICESTKNDNEFENNKIIMTISSIGKILSVAYYGPDENKEIAEKIIGPISESGILEIKNPIYTGSRIYEARLGSFLKSIDIKFPDNTIYFESVEGFGIHNGRRVIVTDVGLEGCNNVLADGKNVDFKLSGYRLIDYKTMATLSSRIFLSFRIQSTIIKFNIASALSFN